MCVQLVIKNINFFMTGNRCIPVNILWNDVKLCVVCESYCYYFRYVPCCEGQICSHESSIIDSLERVNLSLFQLISVYLS